MISSAPSYHGYRSEAAKWCAWKEMTRFSGFDTAILGLEGRGSRFASSRLSHTRISARPPPRDEEMTPPGVRSLSRPAVTAERPVRVANLGRVFAAPRVAFGLPHRPPFAPPSRYATSCAPARCKSASLTMQ